MQVTAIKTPVIRPKTHDIERLIAEYVPVFPEASVLAVTSKVLSLCEGNVVPIGQANKDEIIQSEAEFFLPRTNSKYDVYLTIKHNMLVPSAGVDESNTDGYYVMWPKDPQSSANKIWSFLRNHFKVSQAGLIITDSTSSPLRWGVTGTCVSYSGFSGINSIIGQPDLFGREMRMTKINIADALAASAVLCMGESNEQTPLALLEDLPLVHFSDSPPSRKELSDIRIAIEDDLFGELLKSVQWRSRTHDVGTWHTDKD